MNGDGILDLAFSDLNGVEIAIGKGDGTFKETAASPIAVPSELSSLVAGDFNHDGKLDIAGVDAYNDRIVLLIGAGDGTFTVTPTSPAVSPNWLGPFAIVAADFNNDGVSDLAMLDKNQTSAPILLTSPIQTALATVNHIAPVGIGTHAVEASYAGNGTYPPSVSSTVNLDAGLAPVTISPAAGSYTTVQTLTLSESIPGATIYYSAYGVLNTNGFVPYTGPIVLGQGGRVTIQAYATETGYLTSRYVLATYNLNFPVTPTPSISPAAGYYAGPQTVTITDSDSAAKIYYTTNGTIPTTTSNVYSGPFQVNGSETVVAVALSYGGSMSLPVRAQYVIESSSAPLIYSIAGVGVPGYSGDGGPASLAQIQGGWGTVKDAAGNLYFSDSVNHMVRKIAAGTGIISVVAGNGYYGSSGDGGPATSAALAFPESLALDGSSLYISDPGSETVRKVDLTTGTITTFAGNGTCLISGDGGPASSAGVCAVYGIAVDASHNVFLAEGVGSTIRKVDGATGIITTFAGSSYGYAGDGGPASSAAFRTVYGIAFDAAGNLYIADTGNELIRKITATGGIITPSSIVSTVAGTPPQPNIYPSGNYSGDGGPATSAGLNSPVSVALDAAGNMFIADEYNSAIREVTASTGNISTVAGNHTCGLAVGDGGAATSASLCFPTSVAIDNSANLLITDGTYRIHVVPLAATQASTAAASPEFSVQGGDFATAQRLAITDAMPGASIYVTVDGSTPSAGSSPGYSIPFDLTGKVTVKAIALAPGYTASAPVSATYNVSAFAPLITTVAGNGIQGSSTSGTSAANLEFFAADGLAIDKAGNLYVADTTGCTVWMISAATQTGSIYAGNGICGYAGDGGPATNAALSFPQGLAFDSAGNLYVADQANNVIRKIDTITGGISTVAGHYPAASPDLGDGGPATSGRLQSPQTIAFDSANNLYIADLGNYRVREVSAATGIITTVAGNGSYLASGDGGPATNAGLQRPDSLAVDSKGNIYVASTNGGRIRKIDAATGNINTMGGIKDLRGFTGDGGPATAAEIAPRWMAVDANDNLYFSNDPAEIRKIDPATGGITRVAGIGFPGFSGDGGAATAAQIFYPLQIAFDSAGNLYFPDVAGRIRKVTLAAQPTAAPTFSPAGGTYTSTESVTISDTTSGATIYYTTDGTTPTTSSSVYTAPITINSTETLNAIAVAIGSLPSAVASATYTINVAPPPTFTMSAGAVTLKKGTTSGNTSTVTVQPSNGFNGSVTLSAAVTSSPAGAQYLPTLSFGTTSPVKITSASAVTATLTISTTAASSASNVEARPLWLSGGGFTLALIVLFGIPARRRRWKTMVASLILLLALGSLGACGGGGGGNSGGGGGGGGSIAGTTSGTYVITITGSSGSVTQTASFNLTVQ